MIIMSNPTLVRLSCVVLWLGWGFDNYRVHDCRINIFRDSSKELYSDQLFNAEQIGKDIDPDVREYIFEDKPEVENAGKAKDYPLC